MAIGLAFGLAAARVAARRCATSGCPARACYPVFVAALAAVLYAVTSLPDGSGFLAVFVAGLFLGDASIPYKHEIERFQGSLAGLAEIVVFIALGLTIDLTHLPLQRGCTAPCCCSCSPSSRARSSWLSRSRGSSLSRAERAFIAWSGLKGAVPILLAAFAILGGVDGAGTSTGWSSSSSCSPCSGRGRWSHGSPDRLAIPMHDHALRPWQLSVGLSEKPHGVHEFSVTPDAPADGQTVDELPLQRGDWVSLVVRDGRPLSPENATRLAAGDHVFVLADPARREPLAQLFTAAD